MNGRRKRGTTESQPDRRAINRARTAIREALLALGSKTVFSPATSQLLGAYEHLAKAERDGER